jgi:Zinc knuckle
MSLRVNKKTTKRDPKATHCHVCEKNGASIQECGTHNFRDLKGRVVCQRFLEKQKASTCYKCQRIGHFADRCTIVPGSTVDVCMDVKKLLKRFDKTSRQEEPKKEKSSEKTSGNKFSALCDSSEDDEEVVKPPDNVTVRKPVDKPKPMKSWADWDSDEE